MTRCFQTLLSIGYLVIILWAYTMHMLFIIEVNAMIFELLDESRPPIKDESRGDHPR